MTKVGIFGNEMDHLVNKMARDINYGPEQHDSESPEITYYFWCEKCLSYHSSIHDCPYEDIEYCPHCGQAMRRQ